MLCYWGFGIKCRDRELLYVQSGAEFLKHLVLCVSKRLTASVSKTEMPEPSAAKQLTKLIRHWLHYLLLYNLYDRSIIVTESPLQCKQQRILKVVIYTKLLSIDAPIVV